DQRVTNGTNATQGQAPFLVRLKINVDGETRLCGGTIVDATTIISAAHCIRSPEDPYTLPAPRNTYVFYGSNLARNTNYVRATSLAVHPDWDWYTVENDISIIKIEPLTFVKGYVEPITIYSGQINPLDALQIYGWGVTVTGGTSANLPAKLQTSRIYVSKPADCQVIVYDYKSANGPQICANNHYNIGVDVCQGDSGTGTTIYANGQQYLAGLVSFGTDAEGDATCGEDGSFGVYTNVYYYLPWIESTLG
ncbi:trypsin-like serine protease, partial [Martensiomyces pterosporus]